MPPAAAETSILLLLTWKRQEVNCFDGEKPNASRRRPQNRRFLGEAFDEQSGRLGRVREDCEKEREKADCIVRV